MSTIGTPAAAAAAAATVGQAPAPGEDSVDVQKLRDTNDTLAARVTALTNDVRRLGGFAGRVVSELGLEDTVLKDEKFDIGTALQELKTAKAAADARRAAALKKPAAAGAEGGEGGSPDPADREHLFTETDLNRARTEARDAERKARLADIEAERQARSAAEAKFARGRVRSWLNEYNQDPKAATKISTNTAYTILMSPTNDLPWEIVPDEASASGVKVVTKPGDGVQGGGEYYSKNLNKILEPTDAVAELAAAYPGVLLVQPHPQTGARKGALSGVRQQLRREPLKNPAEMKPHEKIRGAFTRET